MINLTIKSKTFFKRIPILIFLTIFIVFVILFFYYQKIERDKILSSKEDIECVQNIEKQIESSLNEDFVYGAISGDVIIDRTSKNLSHIFDYVETIDNTYNNINNKNKIDDYVKNQTIYNNWNEYKQSLYKKYFIADTIEKSADELVKENGYSSTEKWVNSQKTNENDTILSISNIKYSLSGDNYKVTGTVTNNTSHNVRFIKIKVMLVDKNENVLNTDSVYACGDEGLSTGETTMFECYISKADDVTDAKAVVYDYQ